MRGDTQSKFPHKGCLSYGIQVILEGPCKEIRVFMYQAVLKHLSTHFSKTDLVSSAAVTRSKHPHQPHIS